MSPTEISSLDTSLQTQDLSGVAYYLNKTRTCTQYIPQDHDLLQD